jgi:ribosomal protein S18 acetylase RimI-like enzyme
LLAAAAAWLKKKGMEVMRGPASFSTNDECGLLVEGFDGPPVVMMPYNPPWYADLLESYGLAKAMDLIAWRMSDDVATLDRWKRVSDRIKERDGLTTRTMDLKRFDRELRLIQDLYADAWALNWGFVPMTDAEIDFMGRQLKPVVMPELCVFLLREGKEVGFALALPDLNRIFRRLDGDLFPFGWIKLLLGKNKIDFGRILTLGVRRDFHGKGWDSLLYNDLAANMIARGLRSGEMSWILETNDAMNNALRRSGGEPYRRYRLYDVAL